MEEFSSKDDKSTDLEILDDDVRDPDFQLNHSDIVEENSTLSPSLPISVHNNDTRNDNAKDLADDVDSTFVQVALLNAYDRKKVEIHYEGSSMECNSPCDYFLNFFDENIGENIVLQTNL